MVHYASARNRRLIAVHSSGTSEFVFTKNGKTIKDLSRKWKKAVKAAGLPDILFHDLRRTGIRNLVRATVPEQVAMSISGHRSRTVFERYNITSEIDKKEAMVKLEAAQSKLETQAEQQLPSKMDKFMVEKKKDAA